MIISAISLIALAYVVLSIDPVSAKYGYKLLVLLAINGAVGLLIGLAASIIRSVK
jgi:hypothetical protein